MAPWHPHATWPPCVCHPAPCVCHLAPVCLPPGPLCLPPGPLCLSACAGVSEVHGSFRASVPSGMAYRHPDVSFEAGGQDFCRLVADAAAVARVRQKLDQLAEDGEMA